MTYYVYGVDVSRWQGRMDWERAKSRGVVFATLRCTVGNYYFDPTFEYNWDECKRLDIAVNPYPVVAYNGSSAESQLDHFKDKFGDRQPDLPVTADCETAMIRGMGRREDINTVTIKFLRGLHDFKGHQYPQMYTNKNFADNYLIPSTEWNKYPLHVASYPLPPLPIREFPPSMPNSWIDWCIHQYSADGNLAGPKYGAQSSSIDLDRMRPEYWEKLQNGTPPPPPPPPPSELPQSGVVHIDFVDVAGYSGTIERIN
jgi:lysozyme